MSLAYAIHSRWSSTTAINSLIPASRFFTGRAPKKANGLPQDMPYATVTIPSTVMQGTTNAALQRAHSVKFEFWSNSTSEGELIEKALENVFQNWSISLGGGYGNLRELSPGPCQRQQEEDPAEGRYWHFIFEFTAYIDREPA